MNLNEAVDALRPVYPKVSKPALSLALRSDETGVALAPKAKRILFGQPKPRKKANSLRCRVSDERYAAVRQDMKNLGMETEQDYLEYILDWFLMNPYKEEAASPEDEAAPQKGDKKR